VYTSRFDVDCCKSTRSAFVPIAMMQLARVSGLHKKHRIIADRIYNPMYK
jgi:hypothetical protein